MIKQLSTTRLIQAGGILALLCIIGYVSLQASPLEPFKQGNEASVAAAEKDVANFLNELVATFNKRDAKAVASLFAVNGELVDEAGNVLKTREALVTHYENLFSVAKQATLSVTAESTRVINDRLAMYDGIATVKHANNQPQRESRFAVVLTKEGDRWLVASIRDLEEMDGGPAAVQERLSALKWLVGDWIEEGGSYRIHTSCKWSDDKMSLIQQFSITGADLKELKGSQRISWDPATQKLKSWTHDTNGGYAEALWTASGDRWIVKSSGTNSEGEATSMTMIYRPVDKTRIDLISRDRVVGNDVMNDIAVTIVQRPPEAKP